VYEHNHSLKARNLNHAVIEIAFYLRQFLQK